MFSCLIILLSIITSSFLLAFEPTIPLPFNYRRLDDRFINRSHDALEASDIDQIFLTHCLPTIGRNPTLQILLKIPSKGSKAQKQATRFSSTRRGSKIRPSAFFIKKGSQLTIYSQSLLCCSSPQLSRYSSDSDLWGSLKKVIIVSYGMYSSLRILQGSGDCFVLKDWRSSLVE